MKKTSKKLVTVVATVAAVAAMSVNSFAMQSGDSWATKNSSEAAAFANAIHDENVAVGDDNAYVDGLELLKEASKTEVGSKAVIYRGAATANGVYSAAYLTSAEKAAIANAVHEMNVANGIDNSYVQK